MFVAGFIGFVLDNTIPGEAHKYFEKDEMKLAILSLTLSRHARGAGPGGVGGAVRQGLRPLGRVMLRYSIRHGPYTEVGFAWLISLLDRVFIILFLTLCPSRAKWTRLIPCLPGYEIGTRRSLLPSCFKRSNQEKKDDGAVRGRNNDSITNF